MEWKLSDAKNRFSEVVRAASESGPQIITVRGKETAVVISFEEYRRHEEQEGDLVTFLRQSPLVGVELDVSRVEDFGRDIEL